MQCSAAIFSDNIQMFGDVRRFVSGMYVRASMCVSSRKLHKAWITCMQRHSCLCSRTFTCILVCSICRTRLFRTEGVAKYWLDSRRFWSQHVFLVVVGWVVIWYCCYRGCVHARPGMFERICVRVRARFFMFLFANFLCGCMCWAEIESILRQYNYKVTFAST